MTTEFPLLTIIPLAPLLGAAYNALFGYRMQKKFGHSAVHLPAIIMPAISFIVTLLAFFKLLSLPASERVLIATLWDWMPIGQLDSQFSFIMDQLTLVMCSVVTFVGTLIHIYSVGYMHEEPSYWRFFAYLNLFMFAMLVLVLGDNFVLMFVGWEGVGLCSYLLISFWYQETKNAVAGMKAFVVNRIGDFGFIIGLMLLFWGMQGEWSGGKFSKTQAVSEEKMVSTSIEKTSSVTFRHVAEKFENEEFKAQFLSKKVFGISLVTLIGILFFVGAMGKSAQLPLYVWLPDAMAGPTPVSALIHAATMVTAGVYMVARLHFIFALDPFLMSWVTLIGAMTALFAATIGFFQYDIKKVLAYSTVSQLGIMFIAVGVGAYWVAIIHLMTHAFFKACLFLGSGSVILGCHHEQDMRKMGGLKKHMPITATTYLVACWAIAGFPFAAGFYSKDEILWKAFSSGNLLFPGGGVLIWLMGAVAALGTAFYMYRSYYLTFSGEYRGGHGHGHGGHDAHAHTPHESPKSMTSVLIVLGILSVFGGFLGLPHLWHLPNLLHHWLEPVFESSAELITAAHFPHIFEWLLMGFSVFLATAGWLIARWLYLDNKNPIPAQILASKNRLVRNVHTLVFNKYYVDELYEATIVKGTMQFRLLCDWCDRKIVDALVNLMGVFGRVVGFWHGKVDSKVVDGAVNGTGWLVVSGGAILSLVQNGKIRSYLYLTIVATVGLIVINYINF